MARQVWAGELVAALLLAGVAGCGEEPTAMDLSGEPPDLAVVRDLSASDLSASVDLRTFPDLYLPVDMAAHLIQVGNGGNTFTPQTLTIARGEVISWVWYAGMQHNVVSGTVAGGVGTPDNKFCNGDLADCSLAQLPNAPFTYTHTFTVAGTYPYYCDAHSNQAMTGTITVLP